MSPKSGTTSDKASTSNTSKPEGSPTRSKNKGPRAQKSSTLSREPPTQSEEEGGRTRRSVREVKYVGSDSEEEAEDASISSDDTYDPSKSPKDKNKARNSGSQKRNRKSSGQSERETPAKKARTFQFPDVTETQKFFQQIGYVMERELGCEATLDGFISLYNSKIDEKKQLKEEKHELGQKLAETENDLRSLQTEHKNCREANNKKASQLKKVNSANLNLRNQNKKLVNEQQSLEKEKKNMESNIKSLQSENENLKHEMWSAQGERQHYIDTTVKLEKKIEILTKHNQTLRAKRVEFLEKNRPEAASEKVSDDAIVAKWETLNFNICNFVSQVLNVVPSKDAVPPKNCIDKNIKNIIIEGITRPQVHRYLVQQYVWMRIHHGIFMGNTKLWGEDIGHGLADLRQRLEAVRDRNAVLLSTISPLTAQLAGVIDKAYGTDQERVNEFVEKLETDLEIFTNVDRHGNFRNWALKVISTALEVHILMMKSRALFKITMPAEWALSAFDPDTMIPFNEAADDTSNCQIDIVISPILEKFGNADGENFNAMTVLRKAIVIFKDTQVAVPEDVSRPSQERSLKEEEEQGLTVREEIATPGGQDAVEKGLVVDGGDGLMVEMKEGQSTGVGNVMERTRSVTPVQEKLTVTEEHSPILEVRAQPVDAQEVLKVHARVEYGDHIA